MGDDRRAIASLLLVVQAGLGLLAALGLLVFARLSNAVGALAGPEALAFGGPLILLICALGVAKNWRPARIAVYAWESLTLVGTAISILASAGSSLSLTVALTGIGLPLAIIVLIHRRTTITFDLHTGLTAGMLMLTGLIHLALVPDHLSAPPRLGPLFALDGVAFVILALVSLKSTWRWWRGPAATLLLLTIGAYLVVIARGLETVEDLGIATKLVELAAFGLIVWPRGARVSLRLAMPVVSVLLAIGVSGTVAWAATLRPGANGRGHDGKLVQVAAPPTDAQQLAAANLVENTRTGIARFSDVQVALADGYRPTTPPNAATVHYANPAYKQVGVDPTRPQALVYGNTPNGPTLLGAMYMLPKANVPAPDIGGSLAEWHSHTNLCFLLPNFAIDGFASPFGTCPVGAINGPTPAMLHVWTVPSAGGPFGELGR
jgi:hypothetical protein